ncbi:tigger transposable element-derived protein 4 [Trichonephila clavipes]|nr:tigger transposable element-derived protein 4 [Trichonephila clavipes]
MRLPISSSRSWMTGDLFKNWIHQLDAIFGKQKRKVILFVDNCPAHPKDIPTTNIKIVFLPPTATSKLQLLDQGIIKVVKQKYRKKLVQRYLRDMEGKNPTKINLLDSIHFITAAWDEIDPLIIKRRHSNFQTSQIPPTISYQISQKQEILQNFPDYAAVDDALITSSTRTLGDIIADSLSLTTSDPVGSEREKSDSEEEDDHLPTPSVSAGLQIVGELRKLISTMENAEDMLIYVTDLMRRSIYRMRLRYSLDTKPSSATLSNLSDLPVTLTRANQNSQPDSYSTRHTLKRDSYSIEEISDVF